MRVDKQLAIKLKEKGFDVATSTYYLTNEEQELVRIAFSPLNWNKDASDSLSAPDLHTVTDWLRAKGLNVYARIEHSPKYWVYVIQNIESKTSIANYDYSDHDTALLAGINAAIDML